MAEFIKVAGQEYPATLIYNYKDRNWDMRETQTVQLTMPYAQAAALLPSGTPWSNIFRETVDKLDNDGNPDGQAYGDGERRRRGGRPHGRGRNRGARCRTAPDD